MANRKQTKHELKERKRAAREAARRAERRRTMVTAGIVAAVIAIGGALIGFTIFQDRTAAVEQQRAAEQAASEAAREASEAAEQTANRDVACDAEAPPEAGNEKPTFAEPSDVLDTGTDYRAVIDTSCGQVTIDLAEDAAPETVNSFVFLAQEGFYDGLEIFRNAASIGALQTGSGTNDASWQIGYTLSDELDLAASEGYEAGAVAMANAGPDTSGSQFFFVYNDSFALEPTFTRFATVTDGLGVLSTIGDIDTIGPNGETPAETVYINSVEIVDAGSASEASTPSTTNGSNHEPATEE
ncbi:MAG: peptidylprolyl isomerase [Actinobacteria bacterium]|nr:peptidylprolyl isomerase [Actinomycetota bacterium]